MAGLEERQGSEAVVVAISQLASEALTGESRNQTARLADRMESALRCYLGDRGSDRPAWPYPGFLRGSEVRRDVELELEPDPVLWCSFEEEAARQGISVEQLAEHAAFYVAAEINAGRLTQRILDDLDDDEAGPDVG
jgi:hypothetical protein